MKKYVVAVFKSGEPDGENGVLFDEITALRALLGVLGGCIAS
jgi:hypothetical protein